MASEESNLKGLARFESNENNTHRDGPGFDIDWQGSVGIDPLNTQPIETILSQVRMLPPCYAGRETHENERLLR